jgi:thiol-disulfide isomerase/thioredoxin
MSSRWKSFGLFAAGFVSCSLLIVASFVWFYFAHIKPAIDQARNPSAARPSIFPSERRPVDFDEHWVKSDGTAFDLSTMRGKVVVLNVWATWCSPCMGELPTLAKLAAHYATADDVKVICVTKETPAQILGALKSNEAISIAYSTNGNRLPRILTTSAIPATFVISKAGEIAFQHVGATDWASVDAIRYIEKLRKEEADKSASSAVTPSAAQPIVPAAVQSVR